MTPDSKLADDLADLAEDERSRLGEPPTAEELIAYRDGKLTEEEAERVRDWLAVDPELASVYLDLQTDPAALADDAPEGADVDDAWRRLATQMDRPEARLERPAVVPIRRWKAARVPLALAATLIVGLGVAWLLTRPELPVGEYHPIGVTGEQYRGGEVTVPPDTVGVAFYIDASGLTGNVVVELRDASDGLVREETFAAGGEIVFRVPKKKLESGQVYQLTVGSSGAPEFALPSIVEVFPLVLDE